MYQIYGYKHKEFSMNDKRKIIYHILCYMGLSLVPCSYGCIALQEAMLMQNAVMSGECFGCI